jgi:hypothetical protein
MRALGAEELLDRRSLDGSVDCLAARTNYLDSVVIADFLSDRGLSQVGLPVHEARGRISELGGHPHHRCRIFAGAIPEIGCDRNRADQD